MITIQKETWKPVRGFNKYEVSNHGEIKSFHKKPSGFIMSQSDDKDGYKKVTLTKEGKEFTRRVHRLVAQSFIPNPDKLPVINHLDGDKSNNHVSNLEWSTPRDNTIHGYETRLNNNVGAEHHYAKRYKVVYNREVIGGYTNMFELETALDTDRGTIGNYLKKSLPIYDELYIQEVSDLEDSFPINRKIIEKDFKGVINPILLESSHEKVAYSSLSTCEKLNGFSRAGLRDRLEDGRIYKGKYKVSKLSQYEFLTLENTKIDQVIG